MQPPLPHQDPWIVRAGRWITRRRSVLFAPLFTVVLITARQAGSSRTEWVQDLSGLFCLLAGTRLRILAASYHESSHEVHPITAGPYAWIRHPIYLSNFLLGLGVVLLAGWRPMFLIYPLVFIPVHWMIIRSEETHLSKLYGEAYTSYLREVPALIPWRPYRGVRHGKRNDYKMKKGREWLKAGGYGVGAAAILLFKRAHAGSQILSVSRSFPFSPWFLAAVAVLAIVVRPKVRSSALRALQTALVISCAVLMTLRVPGAVPTVPLKPRLLQAVPVEAPPAPAAEALVADAGHPSPDPAQIAQQSLVQPGSGRRTGRVPGGRLVR